jgi:predicted RNase H-like nuclease
MRSWAANELLGVDACETGWVGIALEAERTSAYFAAHIGDIVSLAEQDGAIDVVAVDMPIGLLDRSKGAGGGH